MRRDREGFDYPVANPDLCISCGKCEEVCPQKAFEAVGMNRTAEEIAAQDAPVTVDAELEEEAQIKASKEELIDLTAFFHGENVEGFAASCGLLDEKIRLYAIERTVTREELESLNGKEQSYTKEEEWIRTEVLPYEEASKKFLDGKNLIALFMYERYLESKGRLSRTQMQAP